MPGEEGEGRKVLHLAQADRPRRTTSIPAEEEEEGENVVLDHFVFAPLADITFLQGTDVMKATVALTLVSWTLVGELFCALLLCGWALRKKSIICSRSTRSPDQWLRGQRSDGDATTVYPEARGLSARKFQLQSEKNRADES